jgi:RNA 3'-terminal phosphate cyclase-like protein
LISIYFGSLYSSQQAVNWIDEGFVKKIRGVTFSTKVSSQFESSMIRAARGIINPLVSDVHIFTDHRTGPPAGKYDSFLLVDILEYFI